MLFAGIDPGKQGGLALIGDEGQRSQLVPTPLVSAGKTGRDEFDLVAIRELLHRPVPGAGDTRGAHDRAEKAEAALASTLARELAETRRSK